MPSIEYYFDSMSELNILRKNHRRYFSYSGSVDMSRIFLLFAISFLLWCGKDRYPLLHGSQEIFLFTTIFFGLWCLLWFFSVVVRNTPRYYTIYRCGNCKSPLEKPEESQVGGECPICSCIWDSKNWIEHP
jgi:hypothetical protein